MKKDFKINNRTLNTLLINNYSAIIKLEALAGISITTKLEIKKLY